MTAVEPEATPRLEREPVCGSLTFVSARRGSGEGPHPPMPEVGVSVL